MNERKPGRKARGRGLSGLQGELVAGGLAIVFVVGGALIYAVYGLPGLLGAVPLFGIVLLLLALLWGILKLIEILGRERE
jgi:hypothetical protein